MPLTYAEREACRQSQYTKGVGHGYGTPEEGYCPIGAVAVLRGATFAIGPDGEYTAFQLLASPRKLIEWQPTAAHFIAEHAMHDICVWTGHTGFNDFLKALEAHGTSIFPAEEQP